jgi:hypothetical protein
MDKRRAKETAICSQKSSGYVHGVTEALGPGGPSGIPSLYGAADLQDRGCN